MLCQTAYGFQMCLIVGHAFILGPQRFKQSHACPHDDVSGTKQLRYQLERVDTYYQMPIPACRMMPSSHEAETTLEMPFFKAR